MLTLRDAQSQKTHLIPPGGAVVGREGGDADITVQDRSVSKKHAKIYARNGGWMIEDLNSANGTFVDDQRITGPTAIGPGVNISLSSYQFQVVKVQAGGGAGTGSGSGELQGENEMDPAVRTRMNKNPYEEGSRGSGSGRPANRIAPSARSAAPNGDGEMGGDEAAPEAKGVGEVIAIIPKAIAHYMVGVPKLLFNPLGTIRDSAENQTFAAMGKMELIAWSLPAFLASVVVGVVCGTIAGLVAGAPIVGTIVGALTGAIVGAIIAVVEAVVTGFIFHWVLEWILRVIFKGTSDAVSRSNYFVIMMTATILVLLPTGITVLIAGIAARGGFLAYFMVLPPIISAAGSALTLFVAYTWFKNVFQTAKWSHIVLLVLMILAPVQGILGAVSAISAASHLSSVGRVTVPGGGKVAVPSTPVRPGTVAAPTAFAVATPAAMATRVAVAGTQPPHPVSGGTGTGTAPVTGGGGDEEPVAAGNSGGAMTEYQRYSARRDEIERKIAADPMILTDARQPQVRQLYARLHAMMADAKKRVTHGRPVAPDDALTQHLIEAETYKETGATVEELHRALFNGH